MPSLDVIKRTVLESTASGASGALKIGVSAISGLTGANVQAVLSNIATRLVPTGGTTGQALAKNSNTDNDVGWTTIAGSSPPFTDTTAIVKDNTDVTKLVRIEASTVATATTRTITMPNADVNLGALVNANIDAAAAIAESKLSLASDAAAGTASRRTLGTGAAQAAAGNDSRLSDSRTPTAHAASHAVGGSDAVTRYGEVDFYFAGAATVKTGVGRRPMHVAGTIVSVRVTANTAPTGAALILDFNKNGTTLYSTQGNRPTVAVSTNAVNATLPDITTFAAGDYLTVDLDQIGSTIAGSDIVLSMRYSY